MLSVLLPSATLGAVGDQGAYSTVCRRGFAQLSIGLIEYWRVDGHESILKTKQSTRMTSLAASCVAGVARIRCEGGLECNAARELAVAVLQELCEQSLHSDNRWTALQHERLRSKT